MAAHTTTKFFAHAFILASVLIMGSALTGCGSGSVSTTDTQTANTTTGSATMDWAAPDTNTDGTQLTTLAGYKVYYGTASGVYSSVDVGLAKSYTVTGLTTGQTYYFTVTAYDTAGDESDYAPEVGISIS